ncbi:dihydroneopterin triphosphate diphosphatase [[Haemophilus] felis]|uniref:Dihydroneopterin triphosphate diphosphatase n=1 Tax=[Haemophilus] felis TaxID=123822 RepID=A0A1T0B4M3_9PAST|nr:dihydroneopterin triphosphate diphosphatase [[Haemophilus] felis]NBI40702.1 dihydroneopterin triphosphate diphosphatase [[Haemophilus] felis]NBI42575.1 dihydroneopterin triphosphate diphosphatase [[Haemophilus] felis]OOS04711.1 dihydroneopterin triphosphate diphosphatase [[Haemophilus] felis]
MKYKNPYSVLVLVYETKHNKVLMLQRQDDPSFWQSITGTIENEETPLQTAIREVREEIGLDVQQEKLKLIDCNHSVKFEIFPQFRHKYAPHISHCTEHWFLLPLPEQYEIHLTEHLDYQWLPPQQAVALTKSWNNRAAIEEYLLI